jgi:hypothetical protein
MEQIHDSARQIHEFSQQQQPFEVALLDLHLELQRLKSFLCCTAGPLCAECAKADRKCGMMLT